MDKSYSSVVFFKQFSGVLGRNPVDDQTTGQMWWTGFFAHHNLLVAFDPDAYMQSYVEEILAPR